MGLAGAIAQLGERLNGIQEVVGSIPIGSTNSRRAALIRRSVCRGDQDCTPGEYCSVDGLCEVFDGCYSDRDCPSGSFCGVNDGVCYAADCYVDRDCPVGSYCTYDGYCAAY